MMRCYYGGGAGTNNIYFRGPSWDIIVPCQMPGPQVFHFVSNGSQILIYTNGVLTGSYGPAINITQGLVFNVAGYTDFVSGIRGKMDEFRLYNRALSSNEISQTWNQELPVTLQVQPPPAPILISPVNGGTADVTSFCWHSLPTALHYTLQVSNTPSFTNLIINASNLIDTMYSVSNGLFAGNTTYYWRVNASNQGGDGPWSTIWSFTMMQHLPLSLKLYLEGFWNGATEIQDTVKVYLAQSASPYTLKDSAKIIPATDGTMSAIFTKANNGNYYLVIKHRNHLETWSMLPQAFATSIPVIYDFTTDSSKAYGFNMKKVGTFWALFVGDPNQDGSIDGIDISIFETQYGLTGPYMSCDFNGDGSVDAMDVQFIPPNFGLTKSTPAMVLKSNPVINTKNVPDNSKVKPKVKSETSDVKGEKKDKKK
jgi:hypothetical protein